MDKYQIVQHHSRVPLSPLADSLVYVYTFSSLIYFIPKSTSFSLKNNQAAPLNTHSHRNKVIFTSRVVLSTLCFCHLQSCYCGMSNRPECDRQLYVSNIREKPEYTGFFLPLIFRCDMLPLLTTFCLYHSLAKPTCSPQERYL